MAYDFEGFFAAVTADRDAILAEVRRRFPAARARAIARPFSGLGVALVLSESDPLACDFDALEQAHDAFEELTKTSPAVAFVWVNASCFGGKCVYHGEAMRDGRVVACEKGDGALVRLVAHLGVALGPDERFEPLTRGYFGA